jgi:hypothetical protein
MARRCFFSFHYNRDVHRAWNARNSWVTQDRESAGFFDSSLFEASQRESPAALKTFINQGLRNTSTTCVLSGLETWRRYWVRYEIQKSFLEGKGLINVHIHTIKNLESKADEKGDYPFDYLAFHINGEGLALKVNFNGKWVWSTDFPKRVPVSSLPYEFRGMAHHTFACLFSAYDWEANAGRQNLGDWIEKAAEAAGR